VIEPLFNVTVPCVFEVAATAITVKVCELSFGPGESFAASVDAGSTSVTSSFVASASVTARVDR